MDDNKFSVTRITSEALTTLRDLAADDGISPVKELTKLIHNEVGRRNVIKIEELPHPDDGDIIPVVYMKEGA